MEQEIWKDVVGYEGLYRVSNCGRIMSLNYKRTKKCGMLKPGKDKGGYCLVILSIGIIKHTEKVHRIVATAFIPNPENKATVNHKNGIKIDNRLENLEWNTNSENNLHSFKELGRRSSGFGKYGGLNPNSKRINQYTMLGEFIKTWECAKDVNIQCGISAAVIGRCCRGIGNTAGGFKWGYV